MKKCVLSLLVAILIISFTTGCGGKINDSSADSSHLSNSKTTDKMSAIDKEKLDETMMIADLLLKDGFDSDYSLVYDEGGVIISLCKENVAQTVAMAKSGDSEAIEVWGGLVESLQDLSTTLQDILEQNNINGIPVTVQLFDKENNNSASVLVVNGKVTYDASK